MKRLVRTVAVGLLILGAIAAAMMPLAIFGAAVPGVRVTDSIVPTDDADEYPTHQASYGKGGYRTAVTLAERDAIPELRRENGMLVFVAEDETTYQLGPDLLTWWPIGALRPGPLSKAFNVAPTIEDLAGFTNALDGELVTVMGFHWPGDWGQGRIARYDATSLLATNLGAVRQDATGVGRFIFDDAFQARSIPVEWFGAEGAHLTGYTNRQNWSFINIDSRPAIQDAIDFKSPLGGGLLVFRDAEYRLGSTNSDFRIWMKPHMKLEGVGPVMSDDGYEGTFASSNWARVSHGTMLLPGNGLTNGFGGPALIFSGRYYSNMPYTAFPDSTGRWVAYRRSGNSVRNMGIWGLWYWAWSTNNPAAANIWIDQVAGITFDGVFSGPAAGPALWARGAFGLRIKNSQFTSSLANGIVITDTSDTIIESSTVSASSGAAVVYVGGANTHIIRDCEFWNNREDLVRWVGIQTVVTNAGQVLGVNTPRSGWTADPVTDLLSVSSRIGSDTGLPVVVKGDGLPGGLETNRVYFIRWGPTGGTSWYLCATAGDALEGGPVIDITSAGGTNWFLAGPSHMVYADNIEELQMSNVRMDQTWAGGIRVRNAERVTLHDVRAWELGLNQTPARQSRLTTLLEPSFEGVYLDGVAEGSISSCLFGGSKGWPWFTLPWIQDPAGIRIRNSGDIAISGNIFARLNVGIETDKASSGIVESGNRFGWSVHRPIVSAGGYRVPTDSPGVNLRTNSQIVGRIPNTFTNVAGDWSVAIKAVVPNLDTTGFPDGLHSSLFCLTSSTNTTGNGAAAPWSINYSFYKAPSGSTAVAGVHWGTNVVLSELLVNDERYGVDVSNMVGLPIEIIIQRTNEAPNMRLEIYIDGIRRGNWYLGGTKGIGKGALNAPYLLVGQLPGSGVFAFPREWIYAIAYHNGRAFTQEDILKGVPWSAKDGVDATVLWDFVGASQLGGVPDLTPNRADGVVQQIGAVPPAFGVAKDEAQVLMARGAYVPRLSKSARNALTGVIDGYHIFQTDSGPGPRWYSTAAGAWVRADGTTDP